MLNKHCFEALDRSLNDIMKTQSTHGYDIPFGGKVVVLGDDFRQILPVISKGSRSEIVGSAINSSYLWKHCKVMKLTVNMRLQNAISTSSAAEKKEFADWLLQVGDGTVKTIDEEETLIEIPPDLLIEQCKEPLLELVNFAYPKLAHNLQKSSFFQERAILAPTLESLEEINNFMLAMIPGDETEYLSCDTPCKSDEDSEELLQDEGEHWNATVKEKFDAELKKYKGELKKYEAKLKKVEAERNRDKVEAKYRVVSNVN
ncbi:uncharacterized protein LOC130735938 [Lotus japonicus]|uniref:uncharacterized protein LOC130735938 n=1 Tax=Lotus japonicus TaxID=34305 RepID=UPI00258E05C7|nr:uncharacterized protein LOC130735938 [Lotus japonicus]